MKYIKGFQLSESYSYYQQLDQLVEMVEGGQEDMAEMMALGLGMEDDLKRTIAKKWNSILRLYRLSYGKKIKVGDLLKLEQLRLEGLRIDDPNDLHSIGHLQNLMGLELDMNRLPNLPKSITNLRNLTYLYLRENDLVQLPKNIGDLKNLHYLYLDSNLLRFLPESITKLKNLTHLYLTNNRLVELPDSIADLENLEYLILDDNELKTLPVFQLSKLKNLKELDLRFNYDLKYEQIQKLREKLPRCKIKWI